MSYKAWLTLSAEVFTQPASKTIFCPARLRNFSTCLLNLENGKVTSLIIWYDRLLRPYAYWLIDYNSFSVLRALSQAPTINEDSRVIFVARRALVETMTR